MRIILATIFLFYQPPPAQASTLPPADLVVVHKAQHQLDLYSGDTLLKSYRIALGWHPLRRQNPPG